MTSSSQPPKPRRAARPNGFPRSASLCAAIFFGLACGYALSLGAFTFDIVVPSFFVWSLLSGLLLSTAANNSTQRLVIDSASTAAAFAVSPFLFGTLRGLLAAQANEVPNRTQVLGYGVINLDAGFLHGVSWFSVSLGLVLFTISFLLVLLSVFASSAVAGLGIKLFRFGPERLDTTKSILLKTGAIMVVIASGVLVVANLSRERPDSRWAQPTVPSTQIGILTIDGPERGRLKGKFLLKDGKEFYVLLPMSALDGIVSKEQIERLRECGPDTDGGTAVLPCEDQDSIEDLEIHIPSFIRAYGQRFYVVNKVVQLPASK